MSVRLVPVRQLLHPLDELHASSLRERDEVLVVRAGGASGGVGDKVGGSSSESKVDGEALRS
jgi:hypothetical protein